MMDIERANRLLERGEIEIAPLAFMRGRTLDDAFVILDEAQNATTEQMKMFSDPARTHSKAVVTATSSNRPSGSTQVRPGPNC